MIYISPPYFFVFLLEVMMGRQMSHPKGGRGISNTTPSPHSLRSPALLRNYGRFKTFFFFFFYDFSVYNFPRVVHLSKLCMVETSSPTLHLGAHLAQNEEIRKTWDWTYQYIKPETSGLRGDFYNWASLGALQGSQGELVGGGLTRAWVGLQYIPSPRTMPSSTCPTIPTRHLLSSRSQSNQLPVISTFKSHRQFEVNIINEMRHLSLRNGSRSSLCLGGGLHHSHIILAKTREATAGSERTHRNPNATRESAWQDEGP